MDIFDVGDARLLAEVRSKEWLAEFEAEYQKPVLDMAKAQFWNSIPDPVKDNLKQLVPEAVRNMEKKYGGNDGNR